MSPTNDGTRCYLEASAPASEAAEDAKAPDRAKWLKRRHAGIGGSEAAVVMGQSRKTPFALWMEKVGLVEDDVVEAPEYAKWGQILEDPVAQEWSRRTGREIEDPGRFAIAFSPKHLFMHCTIDRKIKPAGGRGPGSLSIKCAGEYRREDWAEGPPLWALIQVQHELVVHGWDWGVIAVLIGGNRLEDFEVELNLRFTELLVEKEEEFWDRVKREDPPPVDGSDLTTEILQRVYPADNGLSVVLPMEAYEWLNKWRGAKDYEKEAKQLVQQYQNKIQFHVGNARVGFLPPPPRDLLALPEPLRHHVDVTPPSIIGVSWKNQRRGSYAVQRTEFRVLREIKNKLRQRRIHA